MRTLHKHYIGGEWVKPSSFTDRDIINPAPQEKSGAMILGKAAAVALA